MADNFLNSDEESDSPLPMSNASDIMPGLAGYVKSRFEDSENGRRSHEQRWLQAYKNFRGIYDSTTQYRDSERSKVFVRITKTKVLAAYGQIVDILFANKKFPLVVEDTPVPEGVAKFAHLETPIDQVAPPQDQYGFAGGWKRTTSGSNTGNSVYGFLRWHGW